MSTPAPGASIPPPLHSIVLADDDLAQVEEYVAYLEKNGIQVRAAQSGLQALEAVAQQRPDLVLTEAELPGVDGFELCRRLRDSGYAGPLVMLTSRDEDYDRVLGLEFGADVYLTKPIEPRVLLAHLRAMLRRGAMGPQSRHGGEELRFGSLTISRPAREVTWRDQRIEMSAAEFDLLWLLACHAGEVVPRRQILKALRGLDYAHEDRSVDARLYRLRKRFGDMEIASRRIKTVRPHGYMFSVEPW